MGLHGHICVDVDAQISDAERTVASLHQTRRIELDLGVDLGDEQRRTIELRFWWL